MFYKSILILTLPLSIMFLISYHPMMMGFIIMMMTLMITIISGMLLNSFWVSYILFLIYLGALLVLFIYMASLAPHELLFSMKLYPNSLFLILLLFPQIFLFMSSSHYYSATIPLKLTKLFSHSMSLLTMMTMIYLLFTLFSIMKVTKYFHGPLRMTFN